MKTLRFEVRFLLFLLLLASVAASASAQISPTRLVISQIYGAGGLGTGLTQYDWVELYNNTGSDIDLGAGSYSLQYASTTGSAWSSKMMTLSGVVKSKHFFLIQLANGGTTTATNFATPDLIGSTTVMDLSSTGGKVALVKSTTALTATCPAVSTFVSLVGYGTSTTCNENTTSGSGTLTVGTTTGNNAAAPSATTSTVRANSSGVITDNGNNKTDFPSSAAPVARTSALAYGFLLNGTGTVGKYNGFGTFAPGAVVSGPSGTAGTTSTLGGVAMDSSGNAWSVTSMGTGVNMTAGTTVTNYNVGGLDAPTAAAPAAVAVDGLGNVWVANSGTNTVTELTNGGAKVSPGPDSTTGGYANGGFSGQTTSTSSSVYSTPHGIAVDSAGSVWVSNSGNSTIVQIVGAAAPAATLSTALTSTTGTGVRP